MILKYPVATDGVSYLFLLCRREKCIRFVLSGLKVMPSDVPQSRASFNSRKRTAQNFIGEFKTARKATLSAYPNLVLCEQIWKSAEIFSVNSMGENW